MLDDGLEALSRWRWRSTISPGPQPLRLTTWRHSVGLGDNRELRNAQTRMM